MKQHAVVMEIQWVSGKGEGNPERDSRVFQGISREEQKGVWGFFKGKKTGVFFWGGGVGGIQHVVGDQEGNNSVSGEGEDLRINMQEFGVVNHSCCRGNTKGNSMVF